MWSEIYLNYANREFGNRDCVSGVGLHMGFNIEVLACNDSDGDLETR